MFHSFFRFPSEDEIIIIIIISSSSSSSSSSFIYLFSHLFIYLSILIFQKNFWWNNAIKCIS